MAPNGPKGIHAVVVLASTLAIASACATTPVDPEANEKRHVPPEPGAPAAEIDVEIEPTIGAVRTVVRVDGALLVSARGRRGAATEVKPGPRYVDVEMYVTREQRELDEGPQMEPEIRYVPCGRGRECPRTVMVPRERIPRLVAVEERLCRKSVVVVVAVGARYRIHTTTDGGTLCRVVCTERSVDGSERDCPELVE